MIASLKAYPARKDFSAQRGRVRVAMCPGGRRWPLSVAPSRRGEGAAGDIRLLLSPFIGAWGEWAQDLAGTENRSSISKEGYTLLRAIGIGKSFAVILLEKVTTFRVDRATPVVEDTDKAASIDI